MSAEERSESSERLLVGVVSCCAVAVATCVIVLGRLVDNFAFIHLANLQPMYSTSFHWPGTTSLRCTSLNAITGEVGEEVLKYSVV